MRDTAAKRAAENPGMWPPVVLPPVMAARPKRSVSDLADEELMGKRYAYTEYLLFIDAIK